MVCCLHLLVITMRLRYESVCVGARVTGPSAALKSVMLGVRVSASFDKKVKVPMRFVVCDMC